MLFFSQAISSIHTHFERLFIQELEEDGEDESEYNERTNKGSGNPLSQYGILPMVLAVSERTHTPFEEIMSWSINQTFYLTCLVIDMNKVKEQQVREWQMTH